MQLNEFDKDMAAAAFAQACEHGKARDIITETRQKQQTRARVRGRKKPVLPMIIFGAMSLLLYITLLLKQEWVMDVFTKGGIYTIWPLGTAMAFSFIHGAFASNFLSVLGIEAKKH